LLGDGLPTVAGPKQLPCVRPEVGEGGVDDASGDKAGLPRRLTVVRGVPEWPDHGGAEAAPF
jgi:hypothetical protein